MTQILVLGHSVTAGFWDPEGGWVQRLRTFLDSRALREQEEELIYYVYNLGVGGDDTRDLLQRMDSELEHRYEPGNQNIVLVQIGENDIREINGELNVPPGEFRQNIREIIQNTREYADDLVFVGDFPADPELRDVPHSEKKVSDENRKEYEEIKKQVCREEDVPYIDLFSLREENIHEETKDGIHPTASGHEKVYEVVRQELESLDLI
jgi:lysophospholipase L1-like esterase